MLTSDTFTKVKNLIEKSDVLISSHGYDELAEKILEGKKMPNRKHTKLLHEGKYVAEVEIEITDNENAWSPYISLDDTLKLDAVRELLHEENITEAKRYGKVYILKPVAA